MYSAYQRPRDFLAVIQTGLLGLLVLLAGVFVVQSVLHQWQLDTRHEQEAKTEAERQAAESRAKFDEDLRRRHEAVLQKRRDRAATRQAEKLRLENLAAPLIAPFGGVAECDLRYDSSGYSSTETNGVLVGEEVDWEYNYDKSGLRVVLVRAAENETALALALAHITGLQPENVVIKHVGGATKE